MKKRLTACMLAFTLIFSLIPSGMVYAEKDGAESKAVKLLSALGIMEIDSDTGMFWNDSPVERQEMAQIICQICGLYVQTEKEPMFADVREENRSWVETVVRNGYMTGYGNGRFGPKDHITVEQLVKTIVILVGADNFAKQMGGYPTGYVNAARKLGILDFGMGNLNDEARRIDVAEIIYSALNADIMTLVAISGEQVMYGSAEGETFLTEHLNIYRYSGLVEKSEATALKSRNGAGEGLVQIAGEVYSDPNDITDGMLGCNVTVYVRLDEDAKYGEVVYAEETRGNNVTVIDSEDFISADGFTVNYYKGERKATLKLATTVNVIYNGKATEYDAKLLEVDNGFTEYIDNNDDKAVDVISIVSYESFAVDKVNVNTQIITLKFGGGTIKLADNFVKITRDGEKISLREMQSGSVILVARSGEEQDEVIDILVVVDRIMAVVEGSGTSGGEDYITLKGEKYKLSGYCQKLIKNYKIVKAESGDSGQFFTDGRGNIVYYTLTAGDKKLGYLIASSIVSSGFDTTLKVKMYTQNEKIEILEADDKIVIDDVRMNTSLVADNEEVKKLLNTPQLVIYGESNGVIKNIDFAEAAYDEEKFSLDATGIMVTRKSVVDNKFLMMPSTIMFNVPKVGESNEDYEEIMNDASFYSISNGTNMNAPIYYNTSTRKSLSMYDINANGEVSYAVTFTSNPKGDISGNSKLIIVNNVGEAVNENADKIGVIIGFDEQGKEVEYSTEDIEVLYNTSAKRNIKQGDVIQISVNGEGFVTVAKLVHNADLTDAYVTETLLNGDSVVGYCAYGAVLNTGGSDVRLTYNPGSELTPMNIDMVVSNTGIAVYILDSEKEQLYPAYFDEIEMDDRVFAAMDLNNYTRLMVIYR